MPILYVLIGLPGSGKSYWAREYADRISAVVIGSDDVRNEFQTRGQNPQAGDAVFAEVERRTRAHLQANLSVVLDATHSLRKYRSYATHLARELNVACVAIWFDVPVEEALRRNRWRTGNRFGDQSIPDKAISNIADHFEPPTTAEFDRVVRIEG
jgi:predicted kinase